MTKLFTALIVALSLLTLIALPATLISFTALEGRCSFQVS
jgi:hypothetical protein